ncbi:oxidoreductase [Streptantibioticus silvisoli]|uniref:Oxidoreductase n=1 Tax=Streptantibioticus silvisoli TaxID=2705255 RepID=A0ABT6VUV5_9ACTN|nr:oxidoreductase [Streptantibioticus silvisoli]MDI5962258.1 oxidoreductase [Streptantibioticus silvisoli]
MSVWFITGASRGFGKELAAAALAGGDQVVATARNPQAVLDALPEAGDSLLAVALDVTDQEQASAAVAAATERFGRIDVLVNNAGYGLFGSVEEITDAEARALFDTNVFGLLNVTRAALPTLRAQGAGRVLNIGSSAGFAAGAGRGLYGASKFAVESITEALRGELGPLGIHVTVVEPGSFRTEFLSADSKRQAGSDIPAYADTVGTLYTAMAANNGKQPGDPVKAVAAIRRLAVAAEPPLRLQLGSDCVNLVEGKLASVAEELDQWRELALSTDFPAA